MSHGTKRSSDRSGTSPTSIPGPTPATTPDRPAPLGIRDIAAESVLVLGGGRAILLQLAHPAVGRGVAEHSDFAGRPFDRLQKTLDYVYTTIFGTPDEARAAARAVNHAHVPVHGHATGAHAAGNRAAGDGGPAYSAFDPQLQLWVAATLYDSAVGMHARIYGEPDEESADLLYREYAVLGTALQVPEGLWPVDRQAFRRYFDEQLAQLRATEHTRAVARALLHPRAAPLWLKAGMPLARLVTAGLLTPELRSQFELEWSPARQRRFDRLLAVIRAVYPRLPRALRHFPRDRALAARRREQHPGSERPGSQRSDRVHSDPVHSNPRGDGPNDGASR